MATLLSRKKFNLAVFPRPTPRTPCPSSRPLRQALTPPRIDKFMVASPLVGDGSF
ncbi:MAG: hypothetical protein ACK40X_12105 [Armatimonadota bacterium]